MFVGAWWHNEEWKVFFSPKLEEEVKGQNTGRMPYSLNTTPSRRANTLWNKGRERESGKIGPGSSAKHFFRGDKKAPSPSCFSSSGWVMASYLTCTLRFTVDRFYWNGSSSPWNRPRWLIPYIRLWHKRGTRPTLLKNGHIKLDE